MDAADESGIPNAEKRRFATVTDETFNKLMVEKDALNTRRATTSAVKIFKLYLQEKGLDENFENYDATQLDTTLAKFYTEARSKTGEMYKKASLASIRHGLNRHITNFDIINAPEFAKSTTAFKAMNVELKKLGLGGIEHHPPVEQKDLEKLYSSFDLDVPESLQFKVFVDIMLHFGRRGRENLRELQVTDFACTTDSHGCKYIYLNKDELTKNHQLDENTADGRMYEIKGKSHIRTKNKMKYRANKKRNK